MNTPIEVALPDEHADVAYSCFAVRCDADVAFIARGMRILGAEPVAWRNLEEPPDGIGSWLLEVASTRVYAAVHDPFESGVFRSRPRLHDTE